MELKDKNSSQNDLPEEGYNNIPEMSLCFSPPYYCEVVQHRSNSFVSVRNRWKKEEAVLLSNLFYITSHILNATTVLPLFTQPWLIH